jgi:hypothetical protein
VIEVAALAERLQVEEGIVVDVVVQVRHCEDDLRQRLVGRDPVVEIYSVFTKFLIPFFDGDEAVVYPVTRAVITHPTELAAVASPVEADEAADGVPLGVMVLAE